MTIAVKYTGTADDRLILTSDLAAAGLAGLPDLHFNKANGFTNNVDGLTAAYLIAQGNFIADDGATKFTDALVSALATRASLAPISVAKSNANLTMTGVTSTWTDIDTDGSSNSRPTDIVIPNCVVGQKVRVSPELDVNSANNTFYLDLWVIVAGVPIRRSSPSIFGVNAWACNPNLVAFIGPTISHIIQTGDLEADGSLRLRLRQLGTTGQTRTLLSGGGWVWRMDGVGPFG